MPTQQHRHRQNQIRAFLYGSGLLYLLWLAVPAAQAGGPAAAGQTFLWLAVMLVAARLAVLVERIGMPSVLGELLVGVLLGNLALVGLPVFEQIEADPIIAVLAELGVVILLFQIGLETNLDDMRRVGARAFGVAVVGVIAPFMLGAWVVGPWLLPGLSLNAYLFIGATLTATSVGITGRVLRDLGQLGGVEARIILGAAVIDDVLGLIVLAVVSSLVSDGHISALAVGTIVLQAVAFLAGAIFFGRLIAPHLARALSRISAGVAMKATLVLATGLFMAWLAHHIGLAAIVGAFAAGLLLEPVFLRDFDAPEIDAEIRPLLAGVDAGAAAKIGAVLDRHASHHLQALMEPLGHVFVPVFFVFTGMQVKLESLLDPKVVLIALALSAAAVTGKLVCGLVAGPVRKWVVGWGMVPRGEVGLIFAMVGRQLGVINEQVFSVMLVMVMLTTLITPPVLGRLLLK
jgi:Kef-type K+ transport system membrane component KefB